MKCTAQCLLTAFSRLFLFLRPFAPLRLKTRLFFTEIPSVWRDLKCCWRLRLVPMLYISYPSYIMALLKNKWYFFYFCGLAVIIGRRRRRNKKIPFYRVGAHTLSRATRLTCCDLNHPVKVTSFEKQIENIKILCVKVAQFSLSGSIPPKFEHKLRRHKQRFGKIATSVVWDKDENLLWSRLQWHRSCHSNEMTLLPILLAAVFLRIGNCASTIVYGSFFLQ